MTVSDSVVPIGHCFHLPHRALVLNQLNRGKLSWGRLAAEFISVGARILH